MSGRSIGQRQMHSFERRYKFAATQYGAACICIASPFPTSRQRDHWLSTHSPVCILSGKTQLILPTQRPFTDELCSRRTALYLDDGRAALCIARQKLPGDWRYQRNRVCHRAGACQLGCAGLRPHAPACSIRRTLMHDIRASATINSNKTQSHSLLRTGRLSFARWICRS